VVDPLRLQRLLRGVTDRVAQLRREAGADDTRRADPLWLPGVKYLFVTAIEACIDAAQHVCASEGWGPPETNGDAFVLLGRHGALPTSLAERLRQAAGFRNVLVHDYVTVNDSVVVARLADLSDLDAFVDALARVVQES
jgi:uncharacterized protein YutE (UPF0331/DUF86 family)